MSEPIVALMQPSVGHSLPAKGAARAFYCATTKGVKRREYERGTSCLTRTFNGLLCDALNDFHGTAGRQKTPYTHMAMVHDDVCADSGWLDVMLDELDRTGADLISAVVPIKDQYGLTSTAIDTDDFWTPRRLTLREVFALPETFGAEDVRWNEFGGCLLVNTGCWVMRFDPDRLERFVDPDWHGDGQSGWRFLNKIGKFNGEYLAYDQCEDWKAARDFNRLGMKCLSTRKVGLHHERPQWHNRSSWGDWATDMAWLQYQGMKQKAPEGWRFPEDVEGWLGREEGEGLAAAAAGKDVLEIGSYVGRSSICMAQTARSLTCLDPFDGRATTKPQDCLPAFMENLCRYGVASKVTTAVGTAAQLPQLNATYDLCFIDGAHDYPSVKFDAEACRKALRPGGRLVFHDYRVAPGEYDGRWDPDVTRCVDELLAAGARLESRAGSVAVLALGD